MAKFKSSTLYERLDGMLSEDAWAFVDACMDDFHVDEMHYEKGYYELRSTFTGHYKGKEVSATQVYHGLIEEMAAVIEHLALVNALMVKHNGIGTERKKRTGGNKK